MHLVRMEPSALLIRPRDILTSHTSMLVWGKIMTLTYRTCVWLKRKSKKAKMVMHSRFCTCLVSLKLTQTLSRV